MIAIFENEATHAIQTKEQLYEEQDKFQTDFECELIAVDKEISELRTKLRDALKSREEIRNRHQKNMHHLNIVRKRLGLKQPNPSLLKGECVDADLEMTIGDLIGGANCGYTADSWIGDKADRFVQGLVQDVINGGSDEYD